MVAIATLDEAGTGTYFVGTGKLLRNPRTIHRRVLLVLPMPMGH
jgi:hypothetical protein